MEPSTTIKRMMAGNKIVVPSYQRAYSWDTPIEKEHKNTHTDVFLSDLEEYKKSNANSPYYFGHFIFEEKGREFYVIDGQQRLTTIVIFLSALFGKLNIIRNLSEDEQFCYEDMVKRGESRIVFSTVQYDNQLLRDYVIEQTILINEEDIDKLDTTSARRIVRAFNFFQKHLSSKSEEDLTRMLSIIAESSCTTHIVHNESEAIQMFIFQNNRGKKASNLEIVKAQFMYNVHLYGNEDKDSLIEEIKNRFEEIYKSISKIEYRINEDDVLLYTLRVHFNSLWETNALDKIDKKLSEENSIKFIKDFTHSLSISFKHLSTFFVIDEPKNNAIHSLITLGGIALALPFIIKAYKYGLHDDDKEKLCTSLENLVLRHRLIGTKADIRSRINDEFEKFIESNKDIQPIIERIEMMKTTSEWWWNYWNNKNLEESLEGGLNHEVARYVLWKYENYLRRMKSSERDANYGKIFLRFNEIKKPELEHIAPTKEPDEKPHGYDEYDEEFITQYQDCIGNYLLLTKEHNASIHNDPFPNKHKDYTYLEQQKEVQALVPDPKNGVWDKKVIQQRKGKIIRFIMENC